MNPLFPTPIHDLPQIMDGVPKFPLLSPLFSPRLQKGFPWRWIVFAHGVPVPLHYNP